MNANELRRAFTDFFAERGHTRVDSASLIPHDPTLLFTVAGMVPFKPYFVGEETPPYLRAVTVQKCVRAGGKHNDLDQIGRTSRHLTFFEMMGNFSFGDYFKSVAIPYAWEFVTGTLRLDPSRLWVTVHVSDDDAAAIWRDVVGVPPERIQRLDEDNYWRMADTGPCGPCSEIFWDKGPQYGADGGPAFGGAERFVELWNLVFMQFEQFADGSSVALPKPSIDTGAGLERILSVMQGVDSVWDTDEFQRLLAVASRLAARPYGIDERADVSMRILADHARSTTFLVNDGVFPSNEDRGYVLRRIMRRAIRHAYLLGIDELVLPVLVDAVVDIMGTDYPALAKNHSFVRDVAAREEERFRRTLKTGSTMLDVQLADLPAGGTLPGDVAFQLHDTYGFPLEVTEEVVAERGLVVDRAGFDEAMARQRKMARDARKVAGSDESLEPYVAIADALGATDFVGREQFSIQARVLYATDDSVVLDRTPFYAESGGQVGDIGVLEAAGTRARVIDTNYAVPGIVRHRIELLEGHFEQGQDITASIDEARRDAIRRNHTGTHLLQWALGRVLGQHVKQQGSYVTPDRLRFDFSHYEPLTLEQIAQVEDLANGEVLDNAPVRHYETTKEHAENLGAIAFFGDKYGDIVRVLEAGANSIELCGGTHVRALGDIGPIKIVSEGSIGANLRRIEAVSGFAPIERLRAEEQKLRRAAELVGVPVDELVTGIEKRLGELKDLQAELKSMRRQVAVSSAGALAAGAVDGIVAARRDDMARDDLRDLGMAVRDQSGVRGVVLGSAPDGGGAALIVAVTKDSGLHAGELLGLATKLIQGGGGKDPLLAVAGGKNGAGVDDAIGVIRDAMGAR
ncbi:MAG: alanine--tRNA ligase [Actinobacteria bacterium]|uniref:Alanine--tRNA ligase n=1 Tax=freshwater metagenome TaxID=449393 RepID=A0A6J7ABH2_9ZZZZ|nr:alanine--tRNA ligase [Actinomycetota bacterium]